MNIYNKKYLIWVLKDITIYFLVNIFYCITLCIIYECVYFFHKLLIKWHYFGFVPMMNFDYIYIYINKISYIHQVMF